MKYCTNCQKEVKPKDTFDLCLFIILTIVFVIPGIIYFVYSLTKKKRCPICNLKTLE